MPEMRIDLHVHTAPRSRCSTLDPEEAIRAARARGLDGICFTEHNRLWEAWALRELADRHGFLLLWGVELDTPLGHILVYGLEELPSLRLVRDRAATKTFFFISSLFAQNMLLQILPLGLGTAHTLDYPAGGYYIISRVGI